MGRIISDNYNRANAATLGANWTDQVAGWGISTNTAIHDSGGIGLAGNTVFTGAAWTGGADHFSEVTLLTCPTQVTVGPTVRSATASQTMYEFDAGSIGVGSIVRLYKIVAGAFTQLASATVTITANDVMRCEASGTTIRGVQNSVVQLTVTDSAIASGNPGLYGNNLNVAGSATVDNWSAGDFTNTLVQKVGQTFAASTSYACTVSATGLRNLIVVATLTQSTASVANVPTDNAGNTYVRIASSRATGGGGSVELFYCKSSLSGATTITCTVGSSIAGDVLVFEVSGTDPTANVETNAIVDSAGASATPTGASVTTTTDKDFVAGFIITASSVTAMHAGNAFTIGNISNGNGSAYLLSATPIGSFAPQWDQASGAYGASTAAFVPWVVGPAAIVITGVRETHSAFPKYPMTRQ